MGSRWSQAFSRIGVRFIFLHRSLPYAREWKEGASEKVCARNSPCQDDALVAADFQLLAVREQLGEDEGTGESAGHSKRRGSSKPRSAAGGLLLAAAGYAVLGDERGLTSRSPSTRDYRPRCAAKASD